MIIKNSLRMFKNGLLQIIASILLLSFLIFFLNILISLTVSAYNLSNELKGKLGVYLYFKEGDNKNQISKNYDLIIDLKTRLENKGLKVVFISKDEAIKTLYKRLPNFLKNIEKYGIKNPIPPTIYITFKTEKEYDTAKQIIMDKKYEDVILRDLSDIGTNNSFKKQEQRITKIINFSNFMINFYIFLSVILFLIILWFLILILKIMFYSFYEQIEVEKLIGFSYLQIKAPFLIYTIIIIFTSFIFGLSFLVMFINYINVYFINVFDFNILKVLNENRIFIQNGLLTEVFLVTLISLSVATIFLTKLIKKI